MRSLWYRPKAVWVSDHASGTFDYDSLSLSSVTMSITIILIYNDENIGQRQCGWVNIGVAYLTMSSTSPPARPSPWSHNLRRYWAKPPNHRPRLWRETATSYHHLIYWTLQPFQHGCILSFLLYAAEKAFVFRSEPKSFVYRQVFGFTRLENLTTQRIISKFHGSKQL